MLTKKQCLKALDNLSVPTDNWASKELQMAENNLDPIEYKEQESIDVINQLIEEHFTPKKIKKEEIKVGMYLWDEVTDYIFKIDDYFMSCIADIENINNRFYPVYIPNNK